MGVWLQSLMDSLQTALKGRAGVEHLGREEFARDSNNILCVSVSMIMIINSIYIFDDKLYIQNPGSAQMSSPF